MDRSFFEFLAIADVERIHTQFLAWILSVHCKAISQSQKDELLTRIFRLPANSSIIRVYTERSGIDLLIQTNNEVIVVENKIKSSQHSNQLHRYKEHCEKLYPLDTKLYVFLTLIGEECADKNWRKTSYSLIFKYLDSLVFEKGHRHTLIISEYLTFLRRLIAVVEDFKLNPKNYDMVFRDGKKKKEDKIDCVYNNLNEAFIASNQLETILQKCYLAMVVEQIADPTAVITDTRGDALVNFTLSENINFEGEKFATLIQLQKDNIKFVFVIGGDAYGQSHKKWVEKAIPKMRELGTYNSYGYTKLNLPKTKAYVSLSKKVEDYWHMDIHELAQYLRDAITEGKSMTKELVSKLNNDEHDKRLEAVSPS